MKCEVMTREMRREERKDMGSSWAIISRGIRVVEWYASIFKVKIEGERRVV